MNWKDVPNLFANGKFELVFGGKHRHKFEAFHLSQIVSTHELFPNAYQLIARKIEDMTDDELKIHREKQICIPDMEGVYRFRETPESFLYALSVGCLPEMFEWDETVIDSKTL